jgi:hypothetical protein
MKMSDLHIEQMERDESPSAIQIERGVPMPRQTTELEEALNSMNVGDSFLLPKSLIEHGLGYPQAKSNVRTAFKNRKMRCITRLTDLGMRVWRTH